MSDEQVQDIQPEGASEIDALKAQVEELTGNWRRTAADFENYKRRKESEGREMLEYGKEKIVIELMPSLQSLEQVLSLAPKDDKYRDWLLGLKATITQLEKTMEGLGVRKIPAVGQPFDHGLHEAVGEEESESDGVIREIQPGFTLNGQVMVPAKVIVGKKKPAVA
jgi:molecular chaperone GrpE